MKPARTTSPKTWSVWYSAASASKPSQLEPIRHACDDDDTHNNLRHMYIYYAPQERALQSTKGHTLRSQTHALSLNKSNPRVRPIRDYDLLVCNFTSTSADEGQVGHRFALARAEHGALQILRMR